MWQSYVYDGIAVVIIVGSVLGRMGSLKTPKIKDVIYGIIIGIVILLLVAFGCQMIIKANGGKGSFFNYQAIEESYIFKAAYFGKEPDGEDIGDKIGSASDNIKNNTQDKADDVIQEAKP